MGSIPANGSSSRIKSGEVANALAISVLRRSPPDRLLPAFFLTFSSLNSEKTKFYMELVDDISLQYGNGARLENPEYKFHMYYTGYKKLTFNNGFLLQT